MATYKRHALHLPNSKVRNMEDPKTKKKYKKLWAEASYAARDTNFKPNDLGNYVLKTKNQ
jgi:hypothetical protein